MSNKEKNTGKITVLNPNDSVREQLATVERALVGLKHVSESNYKTSMNLDGVGNLKDETKTENLIKALSSVIGRETLYNLAASKLGLASFPKFALGGGSSEDWTQDIKLRIAIITNKETIDALTKAKDELSKFLSEADQQQMAIERVNTMLAGLTGFDGSKALGQ